MGYAAVYDPDLDFDRWYTDATASVVAATVRPGDRVLELGCATGRMTAHLVAAGATVEGVDREDAYLERARARRLAGATFHHGDVRTPPVSGRFEHVVTANLLHEVPDAAAVVAAAAHHLAPGGAVHVTVPNARSLHRLVAVAMGLLPDPTSVSERAARLETLGFVDPDDIAAWGRTHGLAVEARRGILLKPLPNHLMAGLDDAVVAGFVRVAAEFPEHGALHYLRLRSAA